MHILFVCSANIDRSKTAEDFYSEQFNNHLFRSAGTNHTICNQKGTNALEQEQIDWADLILVMEKKHLQWIQHNLKVNGKQIDVLGIEDHFSYYSIKLIELLQVKCNKRF